MSSSSLGQKVRYFRKRAGPSQLELETAIATSSGSISRIENDEVNPQKETLDKIASALHLTFKQIVYLHGLQSELVTSEEIRLAIDEVKDYFKKKGVLAYLIDDRWRLLYASDAFRKLFSVDDLQAEKILGSSLIRIMVDDSLGITKFFSGDDYEDLLFYQFSRYIQEVGFMEGDPILIDSIDAINVNPIAKRIWNQIQNNSLTHTMDTAKLHLVVGGMGVSLNVIREFIHKYPRFEIIEFIPANPVVRMLSKL